MESSAESPQEFSHAELVAEPAAPILRLVIGLGNPGPRYAATRHNLGFMVLDKLAERLGLLWQEEPRHEAAAARESGGLHLLKPMTFMNASGRSVRSYAAFFKIRPEEMLVVSDDLALPLGHLRIRKKGSAGGHNGLASILQELGTNSVPRLRIGIGPPDIPAASYVLACFAPEQLPEIYAARERAIDAIFDIRHKGLETAMNFHNSKTV